MYRIVLIYKVFPVLIILHYSFFLKTNERIQWFSVTKILDYRNPTLLILCAGKLFCHNDCPGHVSTRCVSCRVVEVCVALKYFIRFSSSTNYGLVQTFKPAQDRMDIDIVWFIRVVWRYSLLWKQNGKLQKTQRFNNKCKQQQCGQ